jgi:hypothetical protein
MKIILSHLFFIQFITLVFSIPLIAQDNFAKDFNLLFPSAEFIKNIEGPPFRTNGEVTYGTVIGFVYKISIKILIKNPSAINKSLKIITLTPDGIEHFCEFNSEKNNLETDNFYNFSYEVTTRYKGNAQIITPEEEISIQLR